MAKNIAKEIGNIEMNRNNYSTHINNRDKCSELVSETVLELSRLGKKMYHTAIHNDGKHNYISYHKFSHSSLDRLGHYSYMMQKNKLLCFMTLE